MPGRNPGPAPLHDADPTCRNATTSLRSGPSSKLPYALYVPRIGRAPAPMTADYETLVAAGDVWIGEETDGLSASS